MKILYGVQATGNGHITRARVMAPALAEAGIEVDYLFSGRAPDKLFDMELFGNYATRRGLTFYMGDGAKVKPMQTLFKNNVWQLLKDVRSLDLSGYDVVISDFEPVTAWAAKLQKKASVGIAHQYAFLNKLPDRYHSRILKPGVRLFAPVDTAIGIHWDHFGGEIVPPLIQPPRFEPTRNANVILVYMPYENSETLYYWFSAFPKYQFKIYCAIEQSYTKANVSYHPLSREGFERDLAACSGVISNCGFGLASETMQYGKKFLSKPMKGQSEQQSNAYILESLGLATVFQEFSVDEIAAWLVQDNPEPVLFPDVAKSLSKWIADGRQESLGKLVDSVWLTV